MTKTNELAEKRENQEGEAEAVVGPNFGNIKKLIETSPHIQKILAESGLEDPDLESDLEEINNIIVEELAKNPEGEAAQDLNRFKGEITDLLRESFDQRLAQEAENLGVPIEDFMQDYAQEEHALRESKQKKSKKSSTKIYETGEGSDVLEDSIKETIVAKVKAGTDSLTGINNRVHFDKDVERRQKEVKHRGEFSMIMIDIDHFKKVNDTYGHQAGDYVLKEVAKTLKANMRKGDSLARYGGEEMVIIAPNANGDTPGFAERLRKEIENKKMVYDGKEIKVTISAGVSPYDENFEEMKKISDTGLYLSKGEKTKLQEGVKVTEKHEGEPNRNQVWYYDKKDGEYKKHTKPDKK